MTLARIHIERLGAGRPRAALLQKRNGDERFVMVVVALSLGALSWGMLVISDRLLGDKDE